MKLGNSGGAPAAFDVSVVTTGNQAPVPQPAITLIDPGASQEMQFDVEHEGFYSVDVRLEGATSPLFSESYTVDCPDPHDPTPEPPNPPPTGGGGKVVIPRFTG